MLLRNNRDGTFSDVSAASGIGAHPGKALGVAIHDFDRDGWVDIFVANDSMRQLLFRNTGQRAFVEVALEAGVAYNNDGRSFAGMGVDAEDYNNDGWPDVIVTALSLERYALFRAVGRGRLVQGRARPESAERRFRTPGGGRSSRTSTTTGAAESVRRAGSRAGYGVARASGLRLSAATSPAAQPGLVLLDVLGLVRAGIRATGRGAAFADLDDDGNVDVVIANLDGPPTLLRNNRGPGQSLADGFELHGTRSNRQGIGAIVSVVDEHGLPQSGMSDGRELPIGKRRPGPFRIGRCKGGAPRRGALAKRRDSGAERDRGGPYVSDRRAGTLRESWAVVRCVKLF